VTARAAPRWDVFCRVVDNFGDAAVCWRLAHQLAATHGLDVRLVIDRPQVLAQLQPALRSEQPVQWLHGVQVVRADALGPSPAADVVIDAFGGGLPSWYPDALAARGPAALWVVLEYLSAEAWVPAHHGLPSPHPSLPIARRFFFPGFGAGTGGLLREPGLLAARAAFDADPVARDRFWQGLGFAPVAPGTVAVSLFGYDNPALPALLDALAVGSAPVAVAVTDSPAAQAVVRWLALRDGGHPAISAGAFAAQGDTLRAGALELRRLPFLAQPDYDRLLWACDINFVRGEDSLTRALWAARPLVWQAYPQADAAHCAKVEAFLAMWQAAGAQGKASRDIGGVGDAAPGGVAGETAGETAGDAAWAALTGVWNGCTPPAAAGGPRAAGASAAPAIGALWPQVFAGLPGLTAAARQVCDAQARFPDLAAALVEFCRDRLK
jgi:uncharacterized repeat protein (TIGR03837 family)